MFFIPPRPAKLAGMFLIAIFKIAKTILEGP